MSMSRQKSKGEGVLEVSSARSKLDGVLQTLVEKKDERTTPEKDIFLRQETDEDSSPMSTPTKKLTLSSTKVTRKRKRGRDEPVPDTSLYHHSYIMKLFDRSVDLAQFSEDTPLYPVCRAWIRNHPHQPLQTMRPQTPDPAPDGEVDPGDIYSLPMMPYIKTEDSGDMRVPSPLLQTDEPLDIHADQNLATPPETLLINHMIRWKQVRQKWKNASRLNELRDAANLKLLKDMYERHCRDQ
jgi:hypothetical protein